MALNIKNDAVERLATEVARLTGESKTEAIRKALDERRRRVLHFLETKVWPSIPKKELGRRMTRAEEDDILGYGPGGV